jgi:hypothetical protein
LPWQSPTNTKILLNFSAEVFMRLVVINLLFFTFVFAQDSEKSALTYQYGPVFGVSFSPLGATLGAKVTSYQGNSTYTAIVAYNSVTNNHLGGYAFLRYDEGLETPATPKQAVSKTPVRWGVQLGSWVHEPHLLEKTETALGIQGDIAATLPVGDWNALLNTKLGLLHLQSFDAFQPDVRVGTALEQATLDAWDYPLSNKHFGVTSVWAATPVGGVFGVWGDAWTSLPLGFENFNGTLQLSLRGGYNAEEVFPLELNSWSVIGSTGYRVSIPAKWQVLESLSLERITLEPKARLYFDGSLGATADIALSADTLINGGNSSIAINVGYAKQKVWFKFGLLNPF